MAKFATYYIHPEIRDAWVKWECEVPTNKALNSLRDCSLPLYLKPDSKNQED